MATIPTWVFWLFTGWVLRGLYRHIKRHAGNDEVKASYKKVSYNEDGTIEWIYKHGFLGYGSRYYYRKDGSYWLKEDYFFREVMDDRETFYYPSGREKYSTT